VRRRHFAELPVTNWAHVLAGVLAECGEPFDERTGFLLGAGELNFDGLQLRSVLRQLLIKTLSRLEQLVLTRQAFVSASNPIVQDIIRVSRDVQRQGVYVSSPQLDVCSFRRTPALVLRGQGAERGASLL